MRYRSITQAVPALVGLFALVLVGCSDDGPTGPTTPFDPDATAQAVAELENRLDTDGDVMLSLALVAPALEAEGGAIVQMVPAGIARPARPFQAQVIVDPAFSMEPIFPSNLLGKTFEWDEALGRYAVSERAGAPANGVRFVLYAVDPFTGQPATPLNEIGRLDLTDEGDAAATRLGVFAETGGVTHLDYTVSSSYAVLGTDVEATVTAAGFISDGTNTLVFDLAQSVLYDTVAETMDVDLTYDLRMDDEDVRVTVNAATSIDLTSEDVAFAITVRITDGGNVTEMQVVVDEMENVSGSVAHNGGTIAQISGTTSAPVFTDAGGTALTSAELAALGEVFDVVEDVFDFVEAVFAPFGDSSVSL